MKNIIAGLHHFILSEDDRKTKEKMLAKYMVESLNTHNYWAFKMLIIEFINLVNVVGQIYFVDAFLGGEFRLVQLLINISCLEPILFLSHTVAKKHFWFSKKSRNWSAQKVFLSIVSTSIQIFKSKVQNNII